MGTELIVPEIVLLEKIQEVNPCFSPVLWEGLRNEITLSEVSENNLPVAVRRRRKMFFSDFVNKAISLPLEVSPELSPEAEKQLYRLHLFCCQQSIHCPEVRRNPLILGYHALGEMKLALEAIMISYRLIDPTCPYKWNRTFFESQILTHKGADGHTIIAFGNIPVDIINKAINEEIITDWLIYRGYGYNGIRTLMDIKNNLQTLPEYKRGGHPADEFSRFERKMREQFNRKVLRKEEALDLEFRKTLVRSVAEQTASQLLASGLSAQDILAQAFSADISQLTDNSQTSSTNTSKPQTTHTALPKQQTKPVSPDVEAFISHLLEEK